jgi:hypothetical protein
MLSDMTGRLPKQACHTESISYIPLRLEKRGPVKRTGSDFGNRNVNERGNVYQSALHARALLQMIDH